MKITDSDKKRLNTKDIAKWGPDLTCGEEILLSGVVYTARDAAHKRLFSLLDADQPSPIPLRGSVIYYAGPTPTKTGNACGSIGPTTSGRMDFYPQIFDYGVAATIGKGERSSELIKSMVKNRAIYLIAVGGAGAYAAKHITDCEEIAFPELATESIKKVVFADFPLIVAIDSKGNNLYDLRQGQNHFQE